MEKLDSCEREARRSSVLLFSGGAISARYLRKKAFHSSSVLALWPILIVSGLGARFGNHTSYQFCEAYLVLGTPRGGRLTVPIRIPSSGTLSVPRRTMRTAMITSLAN